MASIVSRLCSELIAMDTSNYGDGTGPGEAEAAEYVQAFLRGAGYEPIRLQTTSARREAVVLRLAGTDPDRPALIVHGHLDVVPAIAEDWTHPPFEGVIDDGVVWGRGAVDMKDMNAMILATLQGWAAERFQPQRDMIFTFFPDEEAGGRHGAHWLVDNRADLFEGATEAVGEVGGFSYELANRRRVYLIETAEKGIAWLRLRAEGTAAHGSMIADDNAVVKLARVVAAVGDHEFPIQLTPNVEQLLRGVCEAAEVEYDPADPEAAVRLLGPLARMIGATIRHTANPTMLEAGYKHNVIPAHAEARIDARFLPGLEEDFYAQFEALVGPDISIQADNRDVALQTEFAGPLVDTMTSALLAEDPDAIPLPYTLSGGTDGKALSRLGIRCYGFTPLRLPGELDFSAMFHGVDERVPVDSLEFGARVLDRFLRNA